MYLFFIGFIVFLVAALFKLVGHHTGILQWLIIIGGLLACAAGAWGGCGRGWWTSRGGPPPAA